MGYDDIPPPPPDVEQPRNGGNHMYMTAPGQRPLDVWAAERHAVNGWTYRQIADTINCSVSTAWDRVQRGLRITQAPTEQAAERARAAHRAHLKAALEVALDVLARDHVHVSHGRIMLNDDGQPLIDDGPKLAAASKVRELSESLRKLDGLDAPQRLEVSTIDAIDDQIKRLNEQIAALDREAGETPGTETPSR